MLATNPDQTNGKKDSAVLTTRDFATSLKLIIPPLPYYRYLACLSRGPARRPDTIILRTDWPDIMFTGKRFRLTTPTVAIQSGMAENK